MTRNQKMLSCIQEFREYHGLPHNTEEINVPKKAVEAHLDHFEEELTEYCEAEDPIKRIDAAIDLFIFALGGLSHAGALCMYDWGIEAAITGSKKSVILVAVAHHIKNGRTEKEEFPLTAFLVADCAVELLMIEFGSEDVNIFYDCFEIVHKSNMSKICATKEEAESKSMEYNEAFHKAHLEDPIKNPLYTCRAEETANGWAIRRNDGKLLKGPGFYPPEPELGKYYYRIKYPNLALEAAQIADDEQS